MQASKRWQLNQTKQDTIKEGKKSHIKAGNGNPIIGKKSHEQEKEWEIHLLLLLGVSQKYPSKSYNISTEWCRLLAFCFCLFASVWVLLSWFDVSCSPGVLHPHWFLQASITSSAVCGSPRWGTQQTPPIYTLSPYNVWLWMSASSHNSCWRRPLWWWLYKAPIYENRRISFVILHAVSFWIPWLDCKTFYFVGKFGLKLRIIVFVPQ